VRIDPRTGRVTRPFDLGGSPGSIAVGAGAAWVVDARAGTVTRIAG
jgi:hypothetical protein